MLGSFLLSTVYQSDIYEELHFMQDGTPSHLELRVPGWLDNHLPALWTGRREPTEWPKGSLDRNPYRFILLVWAK
jgi:hypothetical protein